MPITSSTGRSQSYYPNSAKHSANGCLKRTGHRSGLALEPKTSEHSPQGRIGNVVTTRCSRGNRGPCIPCVRRLQQSPVARCVDPGALHPPKDRRACWCWLQQTGGDQQPMQATCSAASAAEDVSYAAITVSIPPDRARKVGQVQWPASPPGNPQRDFVTVSADYLDKRAFSAAVSSAAKQSGKSKVLVFVHGFNNRFDDAVYRFAQIVHDCKGRRNSGVVHLAFAR